MLLFRLAGVLQSWTVLCPPGKETEMDSVIAKVKEAARTTLWLPHGVLNTS